MDGYANRLGGYEIRAPPDSQLASGTRRRHDARAARSRPWEFLSCAQTTHRRLSPPRLLNERSRNGKHILPPSHNHKPRMMDRQRSLHHPESKVFRLLVAGKIHGGNVASKESSRFRNLANLRPKCFRGFGWQCSSTRSLSRWLVYDLVSAPLTFGKSASCRVRIAQDRM